MSKNKKLTRINKRRMISRFKHPRIDMHKISEPELREFDNEGAISATKVVRTDDGYVVVINVNWKDGDLVVYSQRDRPRVWQSMDTLIGFLGRAAPSINHFEVFLTEGDET